MAIYTFLVIHRYVQIFDGSCNHINMQESISYSSAFYIIPKFNITNFDSENIQSCAGSERRCLLPGMLRKDSLLMDTSCPRSTGLISGVSCRFATVQLPLSHNCSRSAELNVLTGPWGAIYKSPSLTLYLQLFWPPYPLKYGV